MIDKPTAKNIKNSLSYLKECLNIKKDFIEIKLNSKSCYKNLLMLSFYKNNLIHVFLNEAMIASSIYALKQLDFTSEDLTIEKIWESTNFIS
jgi:glycerol-3-phosphate O-acyltransferase